MLNAHDGKAHGKAQFLLCAKCVEQVSLFCYTILKIKRFDIALKHFHFKIRKNGDNINLINFMLLHLRATDNDLLLKFKIFDHLPPVMRYLGLKAPLLGCHLQRQHSPQEKLPHVYSHMHTHTEVPTHTYTHIHTHTIQTTLMQTTNMVTANSSVTGSGWVYCGAAVTYPEFF